MFEIFQQILNPSKRHIDTHLYDTFKFPIMYLPDEEVYILNDTLCEDLELNPQLHNSMNHFFLEPSNNFGIDMMDKSFKYYTNNIDYLKNTQTVIQNMSHFEYEDVSCNEFLSLWKETKSNPSFLDKYSYIEWDMFKYLNSSSFSLQILSFVNMSSPVLSIIVPFLFLLFPFLILKIQRVPITFDVYISVLKSLAKNHFIGRILNVQDLDIKSVMYLLGSIGIYFYQIYQNINMCSKFYHNIKSVNEHILYLKTYILKTTDNMKKFIDYNKHLPFYENFCNDLRNHINKFESFYTQISDLKVFTPGFSKLSEIGYLLKVFYYIHDNEELETSLKYSVGFHGYLDHLYGINENIKQKHMNFTQFNTESKTIIKQQYYPSYKNENHVKNDGVIYKNIITGPNASGKTTYLKTTALNIIFSQQYGVGFFESCILNPYVHIHSYLNIPDTSGRDSLFQAESRRCKEILDAIDNSNKRHFTIFDELFSGTNPNEASKSAFAFLKYISQYENVDYILTTHYTNICKRIHKNKFASNYKMEIHESDDGKVKYTYKIRKGISRFQGATYILAQMGFPDEIIQSINNFDKDK